MSNSIFNTSALQAAWSDRQKTRVLENHASILFDELCDILQRDISKHYTALNTVCATANSKRDLQIPVWEYKTRYYNDGSENHDETIKSQGLHWTVGTVWKPTNTEVGPIKPIAVRTILRDTDVLARLSVEVFGGTHYELVDQRSSAYTDVDLGIDVVTRRVVLRFYPDGLSDQRQAYLKSVKNKTHAVYTPPSRCTAGILNGTEEVVEAPATPRQSPVVGYTTEPPAVRRVRAKRALSVEDSDDDMPPLIPTRQCYCNTCTERC